MGDSPSDQDGLFTSTAKAFAGGFASALGRLAAAALVGAALGAVAGLLTLGGTTGLLTGATLGGSAALGLTLLLSSA